MSRYAFAWRDRVDDPTVLAYCHCGHAEQIHEAHHGRCTAGPHGYPCLCDKFAEKRREKVA